MAVNVVAKVDDWVKIEHVLVSVSDKTGLDQLIPALRDVNPDIAFYATGGTRQAISDILGAERSRTHLVEVSDYTGHPETQGGLVKTLDFRIYLGLLTETYNESHQADLARAGAVTLDLVLANLYPFESTVSREDVTVEEARANIDIGGPCMVRAAAKNYLRVAAVVDPADYGPLLAALRLHDGCLDLEYRFKLARKAFACVAAYDTAVSAFLRQHDIDVVSAAYDVQDGSAAPAA